MITSAFLNIFSKVITYFANLLPNIPENSAIITAVATASGYISAIYNIIPYITTSILTIIASDIVFESSYFLYKVIYWVIRRFPTQS
jgi:hypothetical protein